MIAEMLKKDHEDLRYLVRAFVASTRGVQEVYSGSRFLDKLGKPHRVLEIALVPPNYKRVWLVLRSLQRSRRVTYVSYLYNDVVFETWQEACEESYSKIAKRKKECLDELFLLRRELQGLLSGCLKKLTDLVPSLEGSKELQKKLLRYELVESNLRECNASLLRMQKEFKGAGYGFSE